MKILSARIYDKYLELVPKDAGRYGDLFEIDSVSLLLGTNGSGKTRMLVSLANAINAPGDNSLKLYVQDDHERLVESADSYKNEICSIYYSALPYRRKLSRRKGIFNASPTKANSKDNKRLENFGKVSKMLGVKTQLEGIVRYTSLVFRSLLIPILSKSKIIGNRELVILIKELALLKDGEYLSRNEKKSVFDLDKNREDVLNQIESILEGVVIKDFGETKGMCYFSALEYLYLMMDKKSAVTIATQFLESMDIINGKLDSADKKHINKLKILAANTLALIKNNSEISAKSYSYRRLTLKIDNYDNLINIKGSDTSILIEWSNQSSGIQALVEQFSLIDDSVSKATREGYNSILLLIDEGDAYLHLDWQRKYISLINNFLGGIKKKYSLKTLQLVLATHSPLLAADIPGDFVISLDSNNSTVTFAAPIEEIISNAFSSSSLGEFAAYNINDIYKRALRNNTTQYDLNLVESIGDISIKAALKKEIL